MAPHPLAGDKEDLHVRSKRLMLGALAGLALALSIPAAAQDGRKPLPGPDPHIETEEIDDAESAIKDGFSEIEVVDHMGTNLREIVDKEFMSKISTDGRPYGFAFANVDVNGDGYKDLILVPRGIQFVAAKGEDGPPTYVYVFDGKDWRLALRAGAMWVGKKPADQAAPTGPQELAFVELQGYRRYTWKGDQLVLTVR